MSKRFVEHATIQSVERIIRQILGTAGGQYALDSGKIKVVSAQDIRRGWQILNNTKADTFPIADSHQQMLMLSVDRDAAQAFYDPSTMTTYMIADRIPFGSEKSVFLHEMMHKHGRSELGSAWNKLISEIKSWSDAPELSVEKTIHNKASSRNPSKEHTALYDEELFAYAVECAVAFGVRPSAQEREHGAEEWLSSVIQSIELIALKLTGQAQDLSLQNIVDLAYALAQVETPAHAARIRQSLQALTTQVARYKNEHNDENSKSPAPLWYSALSVAIESVPDQVAPANQWIGILRGLTNKGVKPDEIAWSGVNDWLMMQDGKLNKQDIQSYLSENGVKIEEKILESVTPEWEFDRLQSLWIRGQEAIAFGRGHVKLYTLNTSPDRAMLFWGHTALQQAKSFNPPVPVDTTRWSGDDFNLPGATKYRELLLTLPLSAEGDFYSRHWDAKNVLASVRFSERSNTSGERILFVEELQSDWAQVGRAKGFIGSSKSPAVNPENFGHELKNYPAALPRAPFVESTNAWVQLCLKRMIRYAVDHNFEKIAFVSGEELMERMNPCKRLNLSSQSLGVIHFYDDILPMIAQRVVRNLDDSCFYSRSSSSEVIHSEKDLSWNFSFKITDEMRMRASGGNPLFSIRDESNGSNDEIDDPQLEIDSP